MNHNKVKNRSRSNSKDRISSPSSNEGSSGGSATGEGPVLKKGPWTAAEDAILMDYVKKYAEGNWNAVQKHSGLSRCGKSCRLRWANHLRPNLRKGPFTPEEEQLIIELHARLGNKWAQMATHLQGRTDNEIKNYWNTRTKRRQRAGLPIYPKSLTNQNQQGQHMGGFISSDKPPNEHFQGNGFELPDVVFDNFNYASPFPDISLRSMLSPGLRSENGFFMNAMDHLNLLRESQSLNSGVNGAISEGLSSVEHFSNEREKIQCTFVYDHPHEPDPESNCLTPIDGVVTGSHSASDGNFSASRSNPGPMKLELPSLQFTDAGASSTLLECRDTPFQQVGTYIQSPAATTSLQSDCISPRNSGLLEALLHEAQTLSAAKTEQSAKNLTSIGTPNEMISKSGIKISEGNWEQQNAPASPVAVSSACALGTFSPHVSGSSREGSSPSKSAFGLNPMLARGEHVPPLDFLWPDALLGSDIFRESSQNSKEHTNFNDTVSTFLSEGLCSNNNPCL